MINSRFLRRLVVVLMIFMIALTSSSAQEAGVRINYNEAYQFPFSMGFEFKFGSPIAMFGTDYGGEYSVNDFSLSGSVPIPSIPSLQPILRLGMTMVRAKYSSGDNNAEDRDHTTFYAALGAGYIHKVSKQMEVGGEIATGFGYSYYSNFPSGPAYGYQYYADLAGRLAFNPSYNLSINVSPGFRYQRALSPTPDNDPYNRFDGFAFFLGFTGSYRFGTDPDAGAVRSIRFGQPQIQDMFAAMQSYYGDNPVGSVSFTNTEKYPLTDVTVAFNQDGFMDAPTLIGSFDIIDPDQTVELPITANFNNEVFSMIGVTPLTGEIQVDYTMRTRVAHQSVPVTYDLYDKNSMTWDDDRKVAAFMTYEDSVLDNYVSRLRNSVKDVENQGYNQAVQTAMQIYFGLTEMGCVYLPDPTLSFEDAQGDTLVIDTVNLPRDTMSRQAGDCDDLTVLFNSLMEVEGIATGFITVPGHIYSMFATGVSAGDYRLIHPDKSMTVNIDGELWLPLEITFIGEDDFLTAWRAGAEEFERYVDVDGALRLYFTREAQEVYRPVGFVERDVDLLYGDMTKVAEDFRNELARVERMVLDSFETTAQEDNSKGSWNSYGIVAAQLQDYARAERAFNSALALDRNWVPPKINLANVYYLREEYQNALRLFHDAERSYVEMGRTSSSSYARLLLNISKTYHELELFDMASRYSDRLYEVNPDLADRYAYLADDAGTARAADVTSARDVSFVEEE